MTPGSLVTTTEAGIRSRKPAHSTLYHGTSSSHRASIEANGLQARTPDAGDTMMDMPYGVYLAKSARGAYNQATLAGSVDPDVWEVDVSDLKIGRDSWDEIEGADENFYVAENIPFSRLKLTSV